MTEPESVATLLGVVLRLRRKSALTGGILSFHRWGILLLGHALENARHKRNSMTEFWIERRPSAAQIANLSNVGPICIRESSERSMVRFRGMAGQKKTADVGTG
jgi:hypothetical protein